MSVAACLRPYVQIARVDHWFKNAFMLLGVVLAVVLSAGAVGLEQPGAARHGAWLATCLIASSNYVLNEILDGPNRPAASRKEHRPVPSGHVRLSIAYAEWLLLGVAGIALAASVNWYFALSGFALWMMGVTVQRAAGPHEGMAVHRRAQRVGQQRDPAAARLVRARDDAGPAAVADALVLDARRILHGRRSATRSIRHIGDAAIAARYRKSFRYYTEERLLVSILFYATACALFAGVFIVRYHLELILFAPVAAGVFAYYLSIGLQPDSPVQNPEKLYNQRGFFAYMVFATVAVRRADVHQHSDAVRVVQRRAGSNMSPLWTLGGPVK